MKKFWVGRVYDWVGDDIIMDKFKIRIINQEADFVLGTFVEFERLTGLKLKPGEIAQVELKVIKKEK